MPPTIVVIPLEAAVAPRVSWLPLAALPRTSCSMLEMLANAVSPSVWAPATSRMVSLPILPVMMLFWRFARFLIWKRLPSSPPSRLSRPLLAFIFQFKALGALL